MPDAGGNGPAATRITVSKADHDEDEAAVELAALLERHGVRHPFVVSSERGRRLLRGVRVAGMPGRRVGLSQTSAGAMAKAARRAGADAVVAAGGGRCLDVAKLAAAGAGLAFVAIPTQLSHDGICSPVSVLPKAARGVTESVEAVAPRLAFFSRPTLLQSPLAAMRAGIGDLISNPLALLDWELAAEAGFEQVEPAARLLSLDAFALVEPLLERSFGQDDVTPGLIDLGRAADPPGGRARPQPRPHPAARGAGARAARAVDRHARLVQHRRAGPVRARERRPTHRVARSRPPPPARCRSTRS